MQVGGGIPCGIYGRAGSEIDALGFAFMKMDVRRVLTVTSATKVSDSTQVVTLNGQGNSGRYQLDNRQAFTNLVRTVTDQDKVTVSETLETTSATKSAQSLEVSFTQKFVVKDISETSIGLKFGASWEQSSSTRNGRTQSSEKTYSVSTTYTCPPFTFCNFYNYLVTGTLEMDYQGLTTFYFSDYNSISFTELGRYRTNQIGTQRATAVMSCCGTTQQCATLNTVPENPRIACDSAGLSAKRARLPASNGAVNATVATFKSTPTAAAIPPRSKKATKARECLSRGGTCPVGKRSTAALPMQQARGLPDASVLGLSTSWQLASLWAAIRAGANRTSTMVVFSPIGCNFRPACTLEQRMQVLAKAAAPACKPGAVVLRLRSQAKLGSHLALPLSARLKALNFDVAGIKTGQTCTFGLRLASAAASPRTHDKAYGSTPLDSVACAIGMAKCRAAGIADTAQCCVPMPKPGASTKADCDCPSSCFPGNASVLLEGGSRRAMRDLRIGDSVQVMTPDGQLAFAPVYLFGHKEAAVWSSMVTLSALCPTTNTTRRLTLSADHFLPVHTRAGRRMTRASRVQPGDRVWAVAGAGGRASLHLVTAVEEVLVQGKFNPFTPAGTIVVDGVVASVHSRWFLDGMADRLGLTHLLPALYQAILLPGYYAVYCLLGPSRVRWLDSHLDFAGTGTDSPVSTLLLLWAYIALLAAPVALAVGRMGRLPANASKLKPA